MTDLMDRKLERPSWRKFALPTGVAVVVLILAIGAAAALSSKAAYRIAESKVTVSPVKAGVFHDFVTLRAKVEPREVIFLDALEGGQVQQVLARSGDVVAAGQPLIRFRNTQLELDVLDREGRLVESITQLQAYEKQLEDSRLANARQAAQIDYEIVRLTRLAARRDQLMAKGFVSRAAHDDVHDELAHQQRLKPLQAESSQRQDALRESQLPQIRAELASLRESLRITRAKLDELTVRAPVAGKLTDTDLYIGQILNRGQRLGQIVPNAGFKLRADVDEFYLGRVAIGQTGTVEIAGREWPVRATRVHPQVKGAVFQVELVFTAAQPAGLLPGQALEGRLRLGGDRAGLLLPNAGWLEMTGGDWAMVLAKDGRKAERRRIKTGRRNDAEVEVLSGLKPGERVITSDYTGWDRIERVELTR